MTMSLQNGAAAAFDGARVKAFEERLVDILNAGALSLMLSVGHRTGLFDAMAGMTQATSGEIAKKAGLQERYVREWFGAMTVSKVVDHDAATGAYALPPEHAALITRAAPNGNLAVFAQYIPLLGTVEDEVVRCFREGGGVPYNRYGRFHEVMAEDSGRPAGGSRASHKNRRIRCARPQRFETAKPAAFEPNARP